MVVVIVPHQEQPSALCFFVATLLFWSTHVYEHDLELFVDTFFTVIVKTKFLNSGMLGGNYYRASFTWTQRKKQKLKNDIPEESRLGSDAQETILSMQLSRNQTHSFNTK